MPTSRPGANVKAETKPEVQNALQVVPPSYYNVYERAEDIQYAPEGALKEGIGMVKALNANIKRIDLGSKMRQSVWEKEIQTYVFALA